MTRNASTDRVLYGAVKPEIRAVRLAWLYWSGLLLVPFFATVWLMWHMNGAHDSANDEVVRKWFVPTMALLALTASGAFFWRDYQFREHEKTGAPVTPTRYLTVTIVNGLALAAVGVFSLVGCVATGSFLPNLIPAFWALAIYLLLWPTGTQMLRAKVDGSH